MADKSVSRKKPAKPKATEDRSALDFLKFSREFVARFKKMEESFASFKKMMGDFNKKLRPKPTRKAPAARKGRK